jgi:transposase
MKAKAHKGKSGGSEPVPGAAADELPERWSVQRKTELVLRLLRGEGLDGVSRESQVPAHELAPSA